MNQTKLDSVYEIDLQWTPDDAVYGQARHMDAELMRAIERQVGLKLDASKLPYEVLVIDHVQKVPTAN